jgi:succinoglycan biosynthesis protein ExoA
LDAEVRVRYYPRRTFGALFAQYFRYGAGRSRTARRHPKSLRARQLLVPAHFLACAGAWVLSPWSLLPLAWPAFYLMLLALHSMTLAFRQRSFAGLLGGPAAAVLHSAWALGFFWGLVRKREARWTQLQVLPLWVPRRITNP